MTTAAAWLQVVGATLSGIPSLFWRPPYAFFFWLVILFVFFQAQRQAAWERRVHGTVWNPPLARTLSAVAYGVIAGAAASLVLVLPGVALRQEDFIYLWPLAILLMLVSPRLMCFAYAGSLLSFSTLLFGWPRLEVAAVMALVAVLHLAEAVLIGLDGDLLITPAYIERAPGEVVGGYLVQRFWPLPLVAVLGLAVPAGLIEGGMPMPDWWPLIRPSADLPAGVQWGFFLMPVAAGLGYGDIAISRRPGNRRYRTALGLGLYSFLLLGLTMAGTAWTWGQWAAALFAAGGHELLARHGGRVERRGRPVFVPDGRSVGILAVHPGGPADRIGLRPGDRIRAVNGRPVSSRKALEDALVEAGFFVELLVERDGAGELLSSNRFAVPGEEPGILTVPEPGDPAQLSIESRSRLWLLELLKRRGKGSADAGEAPRPGEEENKGEDPF